LPEVAWIIEMLAYDVSVSAVLFGWHAEFDPPPPLGATERTRYVKDADRGSVRGRVRRWLWSNAGARASWPA
jgi:hypothetical protein